MTSADRLDATAVNIMEAYYVSIDKLCEAHEILDRQPTRFMNFDELGMNNRGEYEKKGSLKSSFRPTVRRVLLRSCISIVD